MSSYKLGLVVPVRGAAFEKHAYHSGVRVGASALQTPGGVQSEMQRIDDDILQFDKEIGDYVENTPGYPHANPRPALESFFGSVWSPFVQNWMAWYKGHNGWSDNVFWNNAPYAENALKQLIQLRDQAKQLGMPVLSPDPAMPPGGLLDGVTDFAKNIAWVIIALVGGLMLIKVVGTRVAVPAGGAL